MFGIKINKKQTWGKVGMKNQESLMFDKPIKKNIRPIHKNPQIFS